MSEILSATVIDVQGVNIASINQNTALNHWFSIAEKKVITLFETQFRP